MALKEFSGPMISCGWPVGHLFRHISVVVRPPRSDHFGYVTVKTPFKTFPKHYLRVSTNKKGFAPVLGLFSDFYFDKAVPS